MNTRLATAAVTVLVSVLALGACGSTSVDDAATPAAVNSIGYGSDAPRGSAPAPSTVPDDSRCDSTDGGMANVDQAPHLDQDEVRGTRSGVVTKDHVRRFE